MKAVDVAIAAVMVAVAVDLSQALGHDVPEYLQVETKWYEFQRDVTDDPDGDRSGLTIFVDHETGCQYVASRYGMTERLNRFGSVICDGE